MKNDADIGMAVFRDNMVHLYAIICVSEQDADGQTICAD